jgi:LytS/YehU family sensor histidine kinase
MWLLYGELGKQLGDTESYSNALQQIARIYASIGDHPTAINYYNQVFNFKLQHSNQSDSRVCLEIGESYMQLKKFDSALLFFNRNIVFTNLAVKDSVVKKPIIENGLLKRSEAFLALKQYDSALAISLACAAYFKSVANASKLMEALLVAGNAYKGKKDFKKVLLTAKELVQTGALNKVVWFNKDAFGLLAAAYHNLHRYDSAYLYLDASNRLRDSLFTTNNYNNIAFFKAMTSNQAAETKISMLNESNRFRQQRLNILIASLVCFVIIGFIVFRNVRLKRKNEANKRLLAENELQIQRLESEKKQASLQRRAGELEMQALRAQMNPHFIFNCLNAINHFVLKNETEAASAYLTKFSRLIRMVLENSTHKNILLEDELATLRLYIELEQVRFNKRFKYSISIDRDIDTESIVIPPLLLQPFVENAIWHGLMHKDEEGLLTIDLAIQNSLLYCTITDNGVGRENSSTESFDGPKKSMGMQLTANRLKMLDHEGRGVFTVIDLKDANNKPNGTKVIIKIPVNQSETVLI